MGGSRQDGSQPDGKRDGGASGDVDGPDAEGRGGTAQGGLDARRRRLEAELATRRSSAGAEDGQDGRRGSGYAQAVKLSSEFIGGVAVGAGLGYLIDRFFGTSPWGMIVMLLVGFGAGVLNVLRSAGLVARPMPGPRSGSSGPRDGDGPER